MTPVEDFIYTLEDDQRAILLYFHHLLVTELNLSDKLRYKIPFYYSKSWICYLNPTKDNKIDFALTRGNELSNAQGLMDSKGRKQVTSVAFGKVSEIPQDTIYEILQEAILLDETTPYQSKRK